MIQIGIEWSRSLSRYNELGSLCRSYQLCGSKGVVKYLSEVLIEVVIL